jgi:transcriptional regulator
MDDHNKVDRKLTQTEKRVRALELRREGKNYRQIAKEIGWRSHTTAMDNVKAALKETVQEAADELRAVESERLEWLWRKVVERMDEDHLWAVDRGIKVVEQRRALFGLDVSGSGDLTGEITRYLDLVEMARKDAEDMSQ